MLSFSFLLGQHLRVGLIPVALDSGITPGRAQNIIYFMGSRTLVCCEQGKQLTDSMIIQPRIMYYLMYAINIGKHKCIR